ncbi:MAG: hypothetical protein AAGI70_12545, partial [Pseudomonadota bacterium]
NLAFVLAGLYCLMVASRQGNRDWTVWYLAGLTCVIGVGSFLFHTYATRWAALADVAPIGLFILTFFPIAMNRFGGFGWGKALLLMVGYFIALFAMAYVLRVTVAPLVGGSYAYMPAMIALFVVGYWFHTRPHPAGQWLMGVGALFAVSLTFRAIDIPLCNSIPLGTHFMWHILNALVLGGLVMAIIRHGRPARA